MALADCRGGDRTGQGGHRRRFGWRRARAGSDDCAARRGRCPAALRGAAVAMGRREPLGSLHAAARCGGPGIDAGRGPGTGPRLPRGRRPLPAAGLTSVRPPCKGCRRCSFRWAGPRSSSATRAGWPKPPAPPGSPSSCRPLPACPTSTRACSARPRPTRRSRPSVLSPLARAVLAELAELARAQTAGRQPRRSCPQRLPRREGAPCV
jgi:hypothetical protein